MDDLNKEMMEMMKKQWEALGIDPNEMIKYMNNAQEMAKQFQSNFKFTPGSLSSGFENQNNELFNFNFNEPAIKDVSDISDRAVLKSISFGSNLAYLNCEYLNTLKTFKPYQQILSILERDWGIDSRERLLETLSWLETSGHRKYFDLIIEKLKDAPLPEWASKLEDISLQLMTEGEDTEDLGRYATNLVLGYTTLKNLGNLATIKVPRIETWDFSRAINLVRWGYDLEFLNNEEAIERIEQYASQMKSVYNSWEELSEGYILGFMMWSGNEMEFENLYEGHKTLLTHEKSPWVNYAWA